MDIDKIRADLIALLADQTLFEETNLLARNEAIVFINYTGDVLSVPGHAGQLDSLYRRALNLQEKLTNANDTLYQQVRDQLHNGDYTRQSIRNLFDKFTDYTPETPGGAGYEYDSLDVLLEEVIFLGATPPESRPRDAGMIRYEATPARVILELIDNLHFTPRDIFVDIGSGLGLVAMLVNMLTGVQTVGVEYDPAYCSYAQSCVEPLNLNNITFIQADARKLDLNAGTVFYVFTPFVNEVFDAVLERLRYTAIRHQIYICSYGTITYELIKLPWLQIRDPAMEHDFRLAIFTSK
jgi:hypothetical protein